MSDPKDEINQNLAVLANRLPRRAVRALIAELPASASGSQRAGLARKTLIEQLNRPRPNRARRLFTSLVEPLLADDPVLLEAGGSESVPGLIQRPDLAGYWAALLGGSFARVADEVQARLDALCADAVIEDVFHTPEALALRERLRRAALEVIAGAAKAAPTRARFLAAANAARDADIAAKLGLSDAPLPLTWKAVEQFRALLAVSDGLEPVLSTLAHEIGERSSSEDSAAIEYAALVQAMAALEARFTTEPDRTVALLHASGLALHRRGRYDLITPILRAHGSNPGGVSTHVAGAMTGHLRGTARTIARRLVATCPTQESWEAVTLDAGGRSALDALLDRYGAVLEATVKAGLLEHQALRFPVRVAYSELQAAIEKTVIPRLASRLAAAGAARLQPVGDHDDIVRLASWLVSWTTAMNRAALVGEIAVTWRETALAELRREFDAAIRLEPGADLLLRMSQLGRIHDLASSIGGDITAWLMVISVNTLAIIRRRLEDPSPLAPAESAIASCYLGLVEAEMKRTRHWQVSELAEFREIARRRVAV
jgi:hypothetical protein